jgi:flagellar basal-body rod modification protein FlgD
MSIIGIPAVASGANAQSTSGSGVARPSSSTDSLLAPNQFLSLLVDSLKYQDPLNPTSSAQFLQQLASLSQVQTESQVAQTEQTSAAASLIGHTVSGNDPSGLPISGVVTGFSMATNGPVLNIGNDSVSLGTISSVGPATSSTSTPSTPTPTTPTGTSAH